MIHPDTELRFISREIGYGVFATRPIARGTLIWTLCLFDRIFTPGEAAALPPDYQKVLGRYAYVEASGNYVLCWDAGRYVNHSCNPAMLGVGRDFEIAVRDIQPGEEVTCEYGGLNLTGQLECRCGAANCRGSIGGRDVLKLCSEWDATVGAMLARARAVPQPLLAFVQDEALWKGYISGRTPVPSHRDYFAGEEAVPDGGSAQDMPWALPGTAAPATDARAAPAATRGKAPAKARR